MVDRDYDELVYSSLETVAGCGFFMHLDIDWYSRTGLLVAERVESHRESSLVGFVLMTWVCSLLEHTPF